MKTEMKVLNEREMALAAGGDSILDWAWRNLWIPATNIDQTPPSTHKNYEDWTQFTGPLKNPQVPQYDLYNTIIDPPNLRDNS